MTPVLDRLRTWAGPGVDRARRALAEAGPWGRIRAAAVAAWAVVSVAAVAFAFSDPDANALDARVSVVPTGLGTVIVVTNDGEAPWSDLTVRLEPGGWLVHRATVRPGEQLTLGVHRFARTGADGSAEHPEDAWRPARVELRTPDATVGIPVR